MIGWKRDRETKGEREGREGRVKVEKRVTRPRASRPMENELPENG